MAKATKLHIFCYESKRSLFQTILEGDLESGRLHKLDQKRSLKLGNFLAFPGQIFLQKIWFAHFRLNLTSQGKDISKGNGLAQLVERSLPILEVGG